MEVQSASLNGYLEEEVSGEQVTGYIIKGHENKVLELSKTLYGVKQAPRVRNSRIDKYFQENEFTKCPNEHALYIKRINMEICCLSVYTWMIIFIGNNLHMFNEFKKQMVKNLK